MPSEDEIQRIIQLWEEEKSVRDIAKELNGTKSTVWRWIDGLLKDGKIKPRNYENGTGSGRPNTKNATNAKKNYDRIARLELNNKWFIKIEEQLEKAQDSKTLRELAIPYGVAEDKRHLLEPQGINLSGSETPKDSGFSAAYLKRAKEVYAQPKAKDQGSPI